jgi:adenylate kinase family enzyme
MKNHNSKFCVCVKQLTKRADDTPKTATRRFNDYMQIKNNIVDYYKNLKTYYSVDGELSVDETFNQICEIIKV